MLKKWAGKQCQVRCRESWQQDKGFKNSTSYQPGHGKEGGEGHGQDKDGVRGVL